MKAVRVTMINENLTTDTDVLTENVLGNSPIETAGTDKQELGLEDYKRLYSETKKESIQRKERIKESTAQIEELENKLKNYEATDAKKQENKLKEKENYKKLAELRELQLKKVKSGYAVIANELKPLKEFKNQQETIEKTKRENLINEIKNISETSKNDSYLAIAEALPDNNKIELFLKSISQEREKFPVFNSKTGASPKPGGEAINPDSIVEMQKLYENDKDAYNKIINSKRK